MTVPPLIRNSSPIYSLCQYDYLRDRDNIAIASKSLSLNIIDWNITACRMHPPLWWCTDSGSSSGKVSVLFPCLFGLINPKKTKNTPKRTKSSCLFTVYLVNKVQWLVFYQVNPVTSMHYYTKAASSWLKVSSRLIKPFQVTSDGFIIFTPFADAGRVTNRTIVCRAWIHGPDISRCCR